MELLADVHHEDLNLVWCRGHAKIAICVELVISCDLLTDTACLSIVNMHIALRVRSIYVRAAAKDGYLSPVEW